MNACRQRPLDAGDIVLQFADRFASVSGHELTALAEASKELRKEREFSFYGDIDFIPTDEYDADDADTALGQARLATALTPLRFLYQCS